MSKQVSHSIENNFGSNLRTSYIALDLPRLGTALLQVYLPLEYEALYKAVETGKLSDVEQSESADPEEKESGDGVFREGLGKVFSNPDVVAAFEKLLAQGRLDSGDTTDVLMDILGQNPVYSPSTNLPAGKASCGTPFEAAIAGVSPDWAKAVSAQMQENLADQFALAPDFLLKCVTPMENASPEYLPQFGMHLKGKTVSFYRGPEEQVVGKEARFRPKLGEMAYTNNSATMRFGQAGKQHEDPWIQFRKTVEGITANNCEVIRDQMLPEEVERLASLKDRGAPNFRARATGLPFAIDLDLTRDSDSETSDVVIKFYALLAQGVFRAAYTAWHQYE